MQLLVLGVEEYLKKVDIVPKNIGHDKIASVELLLQKMFKEILILCHQKNILELHRLSIDEVEDVDDHGLEMVFLAELVVLLDDAIFRLFWIEDACGDAVKDGLLVVIEFEFVGKDEILLHLWIYIELSKSCG